MVFVVFVVVVVLLLHVRSHLNVYLRMPDTHIYVHIYGIFVVRIKCEIKVLSLYIQSKTENLTATKWPGINETQREREQKPPSTKTLKRSSTTKTTSTTKNVYFRQIYATRRD